MTGVHVSRDPHDWPELLQSVSRRNTGRRVQLVTETEETNGAESLEKGYAFLTADYDRIDKRVNIVLGDPEAPGTHLTHRIAGLREVEIRADSSGWDTTLHFDAAPGRCTLTFARSR
jgi:hypothetical protein